MAVQHPESTTTDTLAAHMLTLITPGYSRGWLQVRQVGFSQLSELSLFPAAAAPEAAVHLSTPDPLMELANMLKSELHEPARGSWLTLDFLVIESGEYEISTDYINNPAVGLPADAFTEADFHDELAVYPRTDAFQPEWLHTYV